MKLSLSVSQDEAVMTREKWGVLAFTLFGDVVCVVMGTVFCVLALGKTWGLTAFPLLFGGAFILFGLIHLIFEFPKIAKKVYADGGLRVLVANKDGLTLNKVIGFQPEFHKWDDVLEIVLAGELKTIDTHESNYTWNVLLVILKPESFAEKTFMQRVKAGISTTLNGVGYTLANYPPALKDELVNVLQRFINRPNVIKYYKKAIFDIKGDAVIRNSNPQ